MRSLPNCPRSNQIPASHSPLAAGSNQYQLNLFLTFCVNHHCHIHGNNQHMEAFALSPFSTNAQPAKLPPQHQIPASHSPLAAGSNQHQLNPFLTFCVNHHSHNHGNSQHMQTFGFVALLNKCTLPNCPRSSNQIPASHSLLAARSKQHQLNPFLTFCVDHHSRTRSFSSNSKIPFSHFVPIIITTPTATVNTCRHLALSLAQQMRSLPNCPRSIRFLLLTHRWLSWQQSTHAGI